MRRRGKLVLGFLGTCSVLSSLTVPLHATASSAARAASPASAERVTNQRLVKFFFSDSAWGGAPFTETEKQRVMVEAMVKGKLTRTENNITHLLSAPEARVRRFAAVFEVDGRVRPPKLHSGYELELFVPYSRKPLSFELENAETGVVNRVEVKPDGSM